ncbi:hypothetical protein EYF80_025523 [Liparis tanakae]|uniref:Uncharacterized protein n=1 Tax=Liparis tanakae TaxID=230148 RepID=A0A4Z2HHF3_9TELE|nr:hypothetical protein EYF80_025523 [Liparis tanakae]
MQLHGSVAAHTSSLKFLPRTARLDGVLVPHGPGAAALRPPCSSDVQRRPLPLGSSALRLRADASWRGGGLFEDDHNNVPSLATASSQRNSRVTHKGTPQFSPPPCCSASSAALTERLTDQDFASRQREAQFVSLLPAFLWDVYDVAEVQRELREEGTDVAVFDGAIGTLLSRPSLRLFSSFGLLFLFLFASSTEFLEAAGEERQSGDELTEELRIIRI